MKRFRQGLCCMLACCFVFLVGCSKDSGTPPEVLIDGTPVVVGQTTPGSLKEAGFTTNHLEKMLVELPDKSWTSSIYLRKENSSYASLTLTNDSEKAKIVSQCVIQELGFFGLEDTHKDLDLTINGINPIGKTQEELAELYPGLELDDDGGDYLFHYLTDGDYSICFQYEKGVLTDIDVKHSFNKSYEPK
mgnify:CR=1 FL=1